MYIALVVHKYAISAKISTADQTKKKKESVADIFITIVACQFHNLAAHIILLVYDVCV